jgi:DNA polymerase III delta prime subunit
MSAPQLVKTLVKSTPNLARMGTSLFWMYLTLGWKVRKARKAFEKQLVSQGMSKEDAKRLSVCFSELKNSITRMLFQGVTVSPYR